MGEVMGVKFGIYTVMHFSANARDVSVKSEGEGKWRALIHIPQGRGKRTEVEASVHGEN